MKSFPLKNALIPSILMDIHQPSGSMFDSQACAKRTGASDDSIEALETDFFVAGFATGTAVTAGIGAPIAVM
jgi:hypothetical protein